MNCQLVIVSYNNVAKEANFFSIDRIRILDLSNLSILNLSPITQILLTP